MIRCSICGARISKPHKMAYYFYRRTADGLEYICDDCAHNFFDGHHVYGLLTGIAEADDEALRRHHEDKRA